MRSLVPTERVLFERPRTSYGVRGEKSTAWERVGEFGCAVEPLAPPQPDDGSHPDGAKRAVRIHVPSALAGSLRGCRATVRGETYDVKGDPMALTASPLPFDRAVEAVRCDG